jgi:signal transduction histidine kinase
MATTTSPHKRPSAQKERSRSADSAAPANLRPVERLLADAPWTTRRAFLSAQKRARARANDALQDGGSDTEGRRAAALLVAGELFRALLAEGVVSDPQAVHIAQRLQELTGTSAIGLAREVLRAPELLMCAPEVASRVVLVTVLALTPLRSASLWTIDSTETVSCACHVGGRGPSRGAHQLAKQLLAGRDDQLGERPQLLGFAVEHQDQPVAALVGLANPRGRERGRALMSEAVPALAAIVQRQSLLAENAASTRALVEASERKLTRLGFDLHDGPIQDVALLAEDLRLFQDQLERVLGPLTEHERVRGRIEDLNAQLVAIDAELRRLSGEVQAASVLLNRPFPEALSERVRAFTARTGIKPRLRLTGDMDQLSTSQQIALLNIIQEALNNIREHARATKVQIVISSSRDGLQAKVIDDGRGFEVEQTRIRAAREGRVGLLAMKERVRLLGGQCRIDSHRGGPTIISVILDPWHPLRSQPQTAQASA